VCECEVGESGVLVHAGREGRGRVRIRVRVGAVRVRRADGV
jgi:hypothetical protein